ncbi:MAG: DNA-3-methyladenine glycosylase 2 family protein [Methanomicrobiales archaeon HGW-Methanomicrobiales-1]|jgi:DNA-3-methyladenine glycosylase II|nr:MAG: DNA-3-methyladenine glycosylase 2 family protein [Methanomicrobiales archaeon HGW-Methanomicrobiales-1]
MPGFSLSPRPPYDFSLSSAIFSKGDPQIRIFENNQFRQAMEIEKIPVLFEVESAGTPDNPALRCTLFSDRAIPQEIITIARDRIISLFNTADDLRLFYRAMEHDEVMAPLTRKLRGLKSPTTPTVFEALIDSIIEQQISLTVARTIQNRIIREYGARLDHAGRIYFCYPTPEILAGVPVELLRACGMTTRKAEYLHDLSLSISNGELDLEKFRNYPDTEQIIAEMIPVRGIGRWTAELTILRGIHRLDAFTADDVGTRRIIAKYYHRGERMSAADARNFADRWGEWKGLAAYYLEIADLLGIEPASLKKEL